MVKRTRQIADTLFECVWPFRGIGSLRVDAKLWDDSKGVAYLNNHDKVAESFPDRFCKTSIEWKLLFQI